MTSAVPYLIFGILGLMFVTIVVGAVWLLHPRGPYYNPGGYSGRRRDEPLTKTRAYDESKRFPRPDWMRE